MSPAALVRPALAALALALPVALTAPAHAVEREDARPDPQLSLETRTLVRLLENLHYNRDAVTRTNYTEVIPEAMKAFDGLKLFFLDSDLTELQGRYKPDTLYWNISALGRLEPATDIHRRYEQRVRARAAWIFDRLARDFEFTTDERYVFDRRELPWPADEAAADALWEQRLKFELLQELLNKKSLDEGRETVRKRYERVLKNLTDLSSSDVVETFLNAVAGLYDPHSNYFSPESFEDFGINMRLQLFGIGALLELQDEVCVIKEIIPGGPADLSRQLKPGDKILLVKQGPQAEALDILGLKLRKIVQYIRGPKDTEVTLVIQPADAEDSAVRREITLKRDLVNIDSARAHAAIFKVPAATPETAPTRVGVISLPTFYGPDGSGKPGQNSGTADVANLIGQLKTAGIDSLVLDLSRNGGGLLNEAVSLAGLFIGTGPVVQVRAYTGEVKVDSDEDPAVAYAGPLIVLTSRFSASASEIVAGALQNHGRAVIVGDRATHGKGTVQTVIDFKSQVPSLARSSKPVGASKLTVQKFYLPNGASTQRRGVAADIVVPSINEFLPIGEADLPHALEWDEISTSFFDHAGLSSGQIAELRARSEARRAGLPEFALLQRGIDRFQVVQAEKSVSLNLEQRRSTKAETKALRAELDATRKALEMSDAYDFTEYFVAAPPPPRIRAPKKTEDEDDELNTMADEELDERYRKMDVHLRESLRVAADLRALLAPAPVVADANISAEPAATAP